MDSYRACYYTSADRQGEIVLTAPEHAGLSDEGLAREAMAEAWRSGLCASDHEAEQVEARLTVGEWRTR